ncbi:MAG: hypothetical protein V1682_05070 [Candidatus Omnitrophota bacterium]
MRFKTIIKLESDARDKSEALDIVEDYLAGNIISGVDMKCVTKPVSNPITIVSVITLALALTAGIVVSAHIRNPHNIMQALPGAGAVQAPLKTSDIAEKGPEFKDEWRDKETQEALELITR